MVPAQTDKQKATLAMSPMCQNNLPIHYIVVKIYIVDKGSSPTFQDIVKGVSRVNASIMSFGDTGSLKHVLVRLIEIPSGTFIW